MKCILKHGSLRYLGTRYSAGETVDITDFFYNAHIQRFDKVAAKPIENKPVKNATVKKVITNDEPKETKAPKAKAVKKPSSKKAKVDT